MTFQLLVKMVESIGIDDIEGPAWKSDFPFQRQTILHGSVNQNTDSSGEPKYREFG